MGIGSEVSLGLGPRVSRFKGSGFLVLFGGFDCLVYVCVCVFRKFVFDLVDVCRFWA